MNMTKQYRAELSALKKQQRSLAAEEKTLGTNAVRALTKIDRTVRQAQTLAQRNGKRAIAEVTRELKAGKRRLDRTGADIAKRISILKGRLA
jgi:tRNA G18 (ribose-2'-O)-methylase SpoU